MEKSKYIWDGSVGACIQERADKKNHSTFYTFEIKRAFKREGSEEFEYSNSFTARNADQIRNVLEQVLAIIAGLEAENGQPEPNQAA